MASPFTSDKNICRIGGSFASRSMFLKRSDILSYMSRKFPACFSILPNREDIHTEDTEFTIYGLPAGSELAVESSTECEVL